MAYEIDPGLDAISQEVVEGYMRKMVAPPILAETVVDTEKRDCEGCVFACGVQAEHRQSESAAQYNRYQDYENMMYGAYMDYDAGVSDTRRISATIADERYALLGEAIEGVIREKRFCKGILEKTVETTYMPFEFTNAGRLKKALMALRGKDTATHTRRITVCQNDAVADALEAGVRFKAPFLRKLYT